VGNIPKEEHLHNMEPEQYNVVVHTVPVVALCKTSLCMASRSCSPHAHQYRGKNHSIQKLEDLRQERLEIRVAWGRAGSLGLPQFSPVAMVVEVFPPLGRVKPYRTLPPPLFFFGASSRSRKTIGQRW